MNTPVPALLPVLSLAIEQSALSPAGYRLKLTTTPEERAQLARALDVLEIPTLSGEFVLEPRGTGAHLGGNFEAEIVQACVVTLEPVHQRIAETVSVEFAVDEPVPEREAEVDLAPDMPDPPERMVGGMIDVGALVEQLLALGLDPYPRREDAEIPPAYRQEVAEEGDSPFSVLQRLKEKAGNGGDPTDKSKD